MKNLCNKAKSQQGIQLVLIQQMMRSNEQNTSLKKNFTYVASITLLGYCSGRKGP